MKVVFLAIVASLLVFDVSASAAEMKELIAKSQVFMDKIYEDVIKEFKKLKARGKTYSPEQIKKLTATITADEFTKQITGNIDLLNLLHKLEKSGEAKNFKIFNQGSPMLKKVLDQIVLDLTKKDGLAPRVAGALVMGGTQVLTDMIRMGLTRYGEMPDSHRVQYAPVG